MASTKIKARGKVIASKHQKFSGYEPTFRPSVKIMKCIGFQKFRYCGENRPGKKYQDKDFLQLALYHMSGKNVQVQIVCFDAERQDDIHPNGLVGKDCDDGVYTKVFPISKSTQIIRIPYLRTERILTKKTSKEEGPAQNNINSVFKARADILPSPYREQCLQQAQNTQKYDTTRVCFGVIVTIEESTSAPLFCLSNVVQNASEKTTLSILKLSTQYVSAQEGGELDIFTSEDGPPITAGKCTVKVVVSSQDGSVYWESPETKPIQEQILYKRVVSYRVPAYEPEPATDSAMRAAISLSCVQSGQNCIFDFIYEPGADSARRLATIHSNKPLRKRPYISGPSDDENKYVDSIKMRVKEKVRSRQNQDAGPTHDLHRSDLAAHNLPVTLTNGLTTMAPTTSALTATSEQDGGVPLHQQEDIVLAKDLVTGEVVYIRTQQAQNPSDLVMYVHDAQQALNSGGSLSGLSDTPRAVAVPASEWVSMVTPSTATTSTSIIRALESVSQVRRPSADPPSRGIPSARKKAKFVSPWVVAEPESSPLINGDISFNQPKVEVINLSIPSTSSGEANMKQEPMEMGPPILMPGRGVHISSDSVPGMSNNLLSGTLISSANLPSLGSLLATGVLDGLEGVRFDESGTLLSSSVFEMVQPYIEKMEK